VVADTRRRLVDAAMELFTEQGFDATSVDEIAARAGLGRTTYFRHFPTKEDVVFPDHDTLLATVDARLATGTAATSRTALEEASALVLDHYLGEGETARQRYQLTRTVMPLRQRELASVHRYFRLFTGHVRSWLGDAPDAALQAELTASAVITAHNHVLRRWLRGDVADPHAALTDALERGLAPPGTGSATAREVDAVLAEVRRALLGP
jgi:AcrR family transcriptional regulator